MPKRLTARSLSIAARLAQVIKQSYACIVDEDIEGSDVLDSSLNLLRGGDVQGNGRKALIGVDQRLSSQAYTRFSASP